MNKKNNPNPSNQVESDADTQGLDKMDLKILNILQSDNQITNLNLADKVGLSPPPCLRRVRRLREQGILLKMFLWWILIKLGRA